MPSGGNAAASATPPARAITSARLVGSLPSGSGRLVLGKGRLALGKGGRAAARPAVPAAAGAEPLVRVAEPVIPADGAVLADSAPASSPAPAITTDLPSAVLAAGPLRAYPGPPALRSRRGSG